MMTPLLGRYFLIASVTLSTLSAWSGEPEFSEVFRGGHDGYPAYRIPSVVVTKKGSVLAFAEARQTLGDQSQNDIVANRSNDGGGTWGPIQILHDDGANSLNNPTAVVEQQSGRVFVMFQRIPGHLKETSKTPPPGSAVTTSIGTSLCGLTMMA